MADAQPPTPPPPAPATSSIAPPAVCPRNGLAVASLVIGVASLVAVASFLLFPVALVTGVVGTILGIIPLVRAGPGRPTNQGWAAAGVICSVLALIFAVVLTVRVGSWATRNTGPLSRLERCLSTSTNRNDVANCFSRFALEVRP